MQISKDPQNPKAKASASKNATDKASTVPIAPDIKSTMQTQVGPPSTASIEAAAKAASQEMVDPEVRGDPRMNRAVQAKLKNPHVSLSDALRIGGFGYPPRATASAVDCENVTLGQRKNQLNRRLRQARLNQAAAYERAAAQGMSDAGSVCGSVASVGTSVSAASNKRNASFLASLQHGSEAQKRASVASLKETLNVLGAAQQQTLQIAAPLQVIPTHQDNPVFKIAGQANNGLAASQSLLSQPPQLLDQLLGMQNMQNMQQVPQVQALQQTATTSSGLLQQQLASFQTDQQQPVIIPAPQPAQTQQQQQQQAAIQQLLAANGQGNTAAVNVNSQIFLVPLRQDAASVAPSVATTDQQSVVHPTHNALLNAITTATHHSSAASVDNDVSVTASFANPYTVVTNGSASVSGNASVSHSHAPSAPVMAMPAPAAPQEEEDDSDDEEDAEEVDDERLEAGLQIFSREIRQLYQSSMLRAGFSNDEIQSSNSSYHNFAFHAWRRECQTLQKLIRQDSSNGGANSNTQANNAAPAFSSNQSVSSHHSHHSNANQSHHSNANRSHVSHNQVQV